MLTVTGTATLPPEVNNSQGLSLEVSILVYLEPGLSGGSVSQPGSSGSDLTPLPGSSGSGGLNPLPDSSGGIDPFL